MDQQQSIFVALQKLKDTEARMQNIMTSLNTIGQGVSVITNQISPIWEGSAKEAYTQYLLEVTKNIQKMENNIRQRKTELNAALSVYEVTERGTQITVDSLSVENIF